MSLYENLLQKVDYARQSAKDGYGMTQLYEVLGRIRMARELGAISTEEYLELDRKCIYEGINNPEYFERS